MDTLMTDNPNNTSDRALRWLGDLDHPFYDDERQRWVWYEASAIGLQVMLIGSYLMAGILVLAVGHAGLILAMMAPVTIGSIVTIGWVGRHSAEYAVGPDDIRRSRGRAAAMVMAFFVIALLIRAVLDGSTVLAALSVAVLIGAGMGVVGNRSARERTEAIEAGIAADTRPMWPIVAALIGACAVVAAITGLAFSGVETSTALGVATGLVVAGLPLVALIRWTERRQTTPVGDDLD